jgi:dipeptidyl aminopeptidase/acylaminoacyl peptidase
MPTSPRMERSSQSFVTLVEWRGRLEYPVGKSLYEFTGWLSHLRISPRGDRIAFVEHPTYNDTFGSLVVTDTAGHRTVLEKDWYEMMDMAWSPRGDEIWFTGSDQNSQRSLYAVTLDGKKRPLLEVPGNLVLKDAFRDGRILLVRENAPRELSAVLAREPKERDLSWFDRTFPTDISPDGNTFVFHEAGVGGGKGFSEFLRKTDGSPPGLLGAGAGGELSPDGKWVLASSAHSPVQLLLFPTGAGELGRLTNDRSTRAARPGCPTASTSYSRVRSQDVRRFVRNRIWKAVLRRQFPRKDIPSQG